MGLLIAEYLSLAFIVIFATNRASNYIDELDKKSNLSGALIGGVLLATITSLPEFITSITSTISLGKPSLAFGNVFGSNIFNLVIIALADIFFIKHFFFNKVKEGKATNRYVIIMYILFMIPLILGLFTALDFDLLTVDIGVTVNFISIAIIFIYIFSIKNLSESENEYGNVTSKYSYKKIITSFVLWSVVVVGASYYITLVTDDISREFNLSSSFAGAIFLGVATSLPELTAVMTLFKLKNYGAAMGNIVGSNVFNLTIISVVDFINYNENIYGVLTSDLEIRKNISALLILGLINSIILMLALLRKKVNNIYIYIIPSVFIIINYLIYLSLSI